MRFVRLLADFSLLTEIFSNKISNKNAMDFVRTVPVDIETKSKNGGGGWLSWDKKSIRSSCMVFSSRLGILR